MSSPSKSSQTSSPDQKLSLSPFKTPSPNPSSQYLLKIDMVCLLNHNLIHLWSKVQYLFLLLQLPTHTLLFLQIHKRMLFHLLKNRHPQNTVHILLIQIFKQSKFLMNMKSIFKTRISNSYKLSFPKRFLIYSQFSENTRVL